MNVAITGNTYPVKDALKAMGARWNPDSKAWMIAADKASEARAIVAGKATGASPSTRPTHSKCHDCGASAKGYYRCYECSREYREGGSRHNGGMSYTTSWGEFVLGDDD